MGMWQQTWADRADSRVGSPVRCCVCSDASEAAASRREMMSMRLACLALLMAASNTCATLLSGRHSSAHA